MATSIVSNAPHNAAPRGQKLRETFASITGDLDRLGSLYTQLVKTEAKERTVPLVKAAALGALAALMATGALIEFCRALAAVIITGDDFKVANAQALSGVFCLLLAAVFGIGAYIIVKRRGKSSSSTSTSSQRSSSLPVMRDEARRDDLRGAERSLGVVAP